MNPDLYLRLRKKEGRLYSDEVVARLPDFPRGHPLTDEWHARSASASRLTRSLTRQPKHLHILDLGCGNGWLSSLISKSGHFVTGTDVNRLELRQASRVFSSNPRLSFVEAEADFLPFKAKTFDLILLASVIQYFSDLPALLRLLSGHLEPRGEIHILDSSLYADEELSDAAQRSRDYFSSLGFPEMAEHYFHHRFSSFGEFDYKFLYQPKAFWLRARRFLGQIDSPFPWIVVRAGEAG
jgi:ubiquinone/menaquinone biosynthesis C-methylase UbiE